MKFSSQEEFERQLVREYFIYGTVEEVYRRNRYNIPISYAGYQRVLDKWGIVKTAGPNSELKEIIDFITKLAYENIPFESLYRLMPPSFRASAATIYRILSYIKEGITRRIATALVLSSFETNDKILIGKDLSTPRIDLGKEYGSWSVPMGFSKKTDPRETAILRILQQEVFTQKALNRSLPNDLVPVRLKPFMFLDIADVRVEVFHLDLPKKFSSIRNFSSFKLQEFRFIEAKKISEKNTNLGFRVGIMEIALGYQKYLELKARNLVFNPLQYKSSLNYFLAEESTEA